MNFIEHSKCSTPCGRTTPTELRADWRSESCNCCLGCCCCCDCCCCCCLCWFGRAPVKVAVAAADPEACWLELAGRLLSNEVWALLPPKDPPSGVIMCCNLPDCNISNMCSLSAPGPSKLCKAIGSGNELVFLYHYTNNRQYLPINPAGRSSPVPSADGSGGLLIKSFTFILTPHIYQMHIYHKTTFFINSASLASLGSCIQ